MTGYPGQDESQVRRPRRPAVPQFGLFTKLIWIVVALFTLATVAAWTFDQRFGDTNSPSEKGKTLSASAQATATAQAMALLQATPTAVPASPTPTPLPTLTADELATYKPNELGQVMVLMYHYLDDSGGEYSRTPEKFRADLEWLHANNFYVIPIHDYINNEIKAPAGKRPIVLTFDDGPVSQFRFITDGSGKQVIDPNTSIGIMEEFFTKYPGFGRGGLFSILPLAPFAWPDAEDQVPLVQEKLQWLVDHGYEIGNHTVDHVNLKDETDTEIMAELSGAVEMTREYAPQAQMEVISVPFGVYPRGGDVALFEGFDYKGKHYGFKGALMVGANPSPSPMDGEFDPMWIPRIRADDEELGKWFQFATDNPGILYVSDGNPETVTIPNTLAPGLAGSLKDSNAHGKRVIRY